MDAENCELATGLVSRTYIQQGAQGLATRRRLIKTLLSQRRLPEQGWDEATIEMLIQDAALMDSNNFLGNVGVGEREARVASGLVARRHYGLAHGIGRSGEVAAEQPKAAGSSLLAKLTHLLAADAMRLAGLADLGAALVLPLATGMTLTLALLALRAERPSASVVLWPRIDQKTCAKAVAAAGLTLHVVPMARCGDELVTNLDGLRAALRTLGPGNVAAVLSTTSCFAPRAADNVAGIAALCEAEGVPHLVNNAYGVQSAVLCAAVARAWRAGRVDGVVQSTDKNFVVPVGGAILAAGRRRPGLVSAVDKLYPGRACMAPLLDLLATLLGLGASGYRSLLAQREALHGAALRALRAWADVHGERLLHTPGNPISMAITLSRLGEPAATAAEAAGPTERQSAEEAASAQQAAAGEGATAELAPDPGLGPGRPAPTFLGSMLFRRNVSGARVVARGGTQRIAGVELAGWGAHCEDYPVDYLTVAAAIGGSEAEVHEFVARLSSCYAELGRRQQRQRRHAEQAGG